MLKASRSCLSVMIFFATSVSPKSPPFWVLILWASLRSSSETSKVSLSIWVKCFCMVLERLKEVSILSSYIERRQSLLFGFGSNAVRLFFVHFDFPCFDLINLILLAFQKGLCLGRIVDDGGLDKHIKIGLFTSP
jgi:hypothetical protein